jgi:hypothetical protein
MGRTVESQGELGLQDRDVVAVAGLGGSFTVPRNNLKSNPTGRSQCINQLLTRIDDLRSCRVRSSAPTRDKRRILVAHCCRKIYHRDREHRR